MTNKRKPYKIYTREFKIEAVRVPVAHYNIAALWRWPEGEERSDK